MKRHRTVISLVLAIFFTIAFSGIGLATEIIWAPINPSFVGGNPLNGTYLLYKAQAQDNNKDSGSEDNTSRLDNFQENLNNSILSVLSARIVEKAFGDSELPTGTFRVGDFEVTVTDNITSLGVTVVDVPNNTRTVISIPTLQ